jgi:hypothetical protein
MTDAPSADALYNESAVIEQALVLLDQEGSGISFIMVQGGLVAPAPSATPPLAAPPPPTSTAPPVPASVGVTVALPNAPALANAVVDWLTTRQDELKDQLAALGNPPRTAISPPPPLPVMPPPEVVAVSVPVSEPSPAMPPPPPEVVPAVDIPPPPPMPDPASLVGVPELLEEESHA